MTAASFVDCHSHVVPSGDDGAATVAEGAALCREAARRGTRLLFATPHVWPNLSLTAEREARVREAFAAARARAGLELRLGWELTPHARLLGEDPRRYELEGTGCVLMEVPFVGGIDDVWLVAEHVAEHGLTPVIAHPERGDAVLAEPEHAFELARRGFPLQVNATSLTGYHGPEIESLAWRLLEEGVVAIVGSDGHRRTRPPHLDAAYALVRARAGAAADPLFDGSALGLGAPEVAETSAAGGRHG